MFIMSTSVDIVNKVNFGCLNYNTTYLLYKTRNKKKLKYCNVTQTFD